MCRGDATVHFVFLNGSTHFFDCQKQVSYSSGLFQLPHSACDEPGGGHTTVVFDVRRESTVLFKISGRIFSETKITHTPHSISDTVVLAEE